MIKIIDKLNTVHDLVSHNFSDPQTIEGRRALKAVNILRYAIHELNEKQRELDTANYRLERLKADIDGEGTELANKTVGKVKKMLIQEIEKIGSDYWVYREEEMWNDLKKQVLELQETTRILNEQLVDSHKQIENK